VRTLLASVAGTVLLVLLLSAVAAAAEPSATPALLEGGDLRSDGEGPGLVGNPLLILAAVVGLGIATAGLTVVLARLARRDHA
jgi:hypothetical protein